MGINKVQTNTCEYLNCDAILAKMSMPTQLTITRLNKAGRK